jgi:hypothetical protein
VHEPTICYSYLLSFSFRFAVCVFRLAHSALLFLSSFRSPSTASCLTFILLLLCCSRFTLIFLLLCCSCLPFVLLLCCSCLPFVLLFLLSCNLISYSFSPLDVVLTVHRRRKTANIQYSYFKSLFFMTTYTYTYFLSTVLKKIKNCAHIWRPILALMVIIFAAGGVNNFRTQTIPF